MKKKKVEVELLYEPEPSFEQDFTEFVETVLSWESPENLTRRQKGAKHRNESDVLEDTARKK